MNMLYFFCLIGAATENYSQAHKPLVKKRIVISNPDPLVLVKQTGLVDYVEFLHI